MTRPVLALLLSACVAVAACASQTQDSTTGVAEDGVVAIDGNDELQFVPSDVTADTGDLEIALTCVGSAAHTFVLEATEELVTECTADATGTGQVSLEPGSYDFYCSIPGHERAGMVGTLTVEG